MADLCSPLMIAGYMVSDRSCSSPVTFYAFTAGTVQIILSAKYCRDMGMVVVVRRPTTSLSLLNV